MPRHALRVVSVLLLLAAAILAPLIASGYSEMKKASSAGSYLEAARHYRTAAQRLPWRADLYELAGHAYYHAKEYSQAEAVYQKAYQRAALSSDGWVAWGDVLYLDGDPAQAAQIWEQGLEQENPSETLYSRLSQIYKENGVYSKAAQVLQKYVSLHAEDASARYRLGLLLTLTDPDAALSELIAASQLDPLLDPAVQTLRSALNLASLNDSASARLVLIGRGLGLVQEWGLARAAFESAVEADEGNAEAWAWLGESNHHNGRDGGSELERAFELDPNSATVRGLRGLYFERSGNFRKALIEFQAAALRDDKNPAWQVSIGATYSKLGDLIQALAAYQAATALAPEDAQYWHLLALFCAQNHVNVNTVGIPAAQKAVVLEKDSPASLDLLGWLLLLDERYEESERILNQAVGLDPQNASVHLHLGMLDLQMENRTAAYDHFVRARDLGNTDAQAILNQYFP
ncbi:MAG TPA: tetratricopeptide repeat protein [Anaerolineales bacterium]|nr:tetratricopeptide repeat protein [Anaerolineales bacterium]